MEIKIIDESEVIEGKESEKRHERVLPLGEIAKEHLKIISEDKVIKCERRTIGLTSNCSICQGVAKEMFDRCKNKWTDY